MNTNLNEAKECLLPCPFCGSEAEWDFDCGENDPPVRIAFCSNKKCQLNLTAFGKDAWNTRAPQPKAKCFGCDDGEALVTGLVCSECGQEGKDATVDEMLAERGPVLSWQELSAFKARAEHYAANAKTKGEKRLAKDALAMAAWIEAEGNANAVMGNPITLPVAGIPVTEQPKAMEAAPSDRVENILRKLMARTGLGFDDERILRTLLTEEFQNVLRGINEASAESKTWQELTQQRIDQVVVLDNQLAAAQRELSEARAELDSANEFNDSDLPLSKVMAEIHDLVFDFKPDPDSDNAGIITDRVAAAAELGKDALALTAQLTAAQQRIAEMEKESAPYWLCYALAEQLENKECERSGINCVQSSDCITEWCPQCAATHWLAEQRELSKPAAIAQTKGKE